MWALRSLEEFTAAYGFLASNPWLENTPISRYVGTTMYVYLHGYFYKGVSLRQLLIQLGCEDLLVPIDHLRDEPIGSHDLGWVIGFFRDKVIAHPGYNMRMVWTEITEADPVIGPDGDEAAALAFSRDVSSRVGDLIGATVGLREVLASRYPQACG